jgi:predicted DNA-binding antitoxin AbrB/MazE fold protein
MLSVRGIYENGRVRLLEPVPHKKRHKVIITILEDVKDAEDDAYEIDTHVFDDLVGIIEAREDGSEAHDRYILPGKS